MASSFLPGGGPPRDIPRLAPIDPNFKKIGAEVAAGADDAGFLAGIWAALLKWVPELVSSVLGVILRAAGWLAVGIARAIMKAEDRADPAFQTLAATAVQDLFGVEVNIGQVGQPGGRASRQAAAKSIGEGVLRGLFSEFTGAGGRALEPSSTGAEKYLTTVTQLALEGWLEGWLAEMFSAGQIETFGDLDDIMSDVLGLGRLSRRVMAPPMSILVEKPFEWLLNKQYRPTQLAAGQAVRQFVRGRWTRAQLTEELARQGYSDDRIEALVNAEARFLGIDDLDCLISHGIWTLDQAVQHLRDSGMPEPIARALLACAEAKKLDAYRKQSVDAAAAAYIARDIGSDQLRRVIDTSGLPERERLEIFRVAGIRREFKSRDLSVSDLEQAVRRGIKTLDDFRGALLKLGYSLDDARTLELLLLSEVKDEQAAVKKRAEIEARQEAERKAREAAAAARREQVAEQLAVREISLAQFEELVRRGIRSTDDYRLFLAAQRYSSDDQEALAELLETQLAGRAAAEERRAELARQAAVRQVDLSALEAAVKRGFVRIEDYRLALSDRGFGAEDTELLVDLLSAEIAERDEAARRREEAAARLAPRAISLSDLELAVRRGLRSLASYRALLLAQGFNAEDTDTLAAILQADIDADVAARAERAEATRRLAARDLSLPDLERAVRAGVRTLDEYRRALTSGGLIPSAVDTLAALLTSEVAADKAAARAKTDAAARLATRAISLSDVERAVKLGVLSVDAYDRVLRREGFDGGDRETLRAILTTELAATAADKARRELAARTLAARELSLAQFETAVRRGLRPLTDYASFLAREGFTSADQATLVGLLTLQIDADKAAERRRAEIDTELAARQLSLSQFERAVKEGIRPIDDYVAFLEAQGYGEEDVATLVALVIANMPEETPP